MSLFKKKDKIKGSCCCGDCGEEEFEKEEIKGKEDIRVKILGTGCAKCQSLEKATKEALSEMGQNTEVDHITDLAQIAAYGVMTTPALVIDEKVVSHGRVLKKDEVKSVLKSYYD